MILLAVAGACGRMGRLILNLAQQDKEFRIVGAMEQSSHPMLGRDLGAVLGLAETGVRLTSRPSEALERADVLVDFSHFSAVSAHLKAAVKSGTAYVLGATGLNPAHYKALKAAAKVIPVVEAPNMSVGVNLLLDLVAQTASALDESYDIEITEVHHRMKKDAPSGTALKLLDAAAGARRRQVKKDVVYGRRGEIGVRPKGQIGVQAVRGGDVIGEHVVAFLGDGERVELVHRASSREAFARGALRAAKFSAKRRRGLYDMKQVLGLR